MKSYPRAQDFDLPPQLATYLNALENALVDRDRQIKELQEVLQNAVMQEGSDAFVPNVSTRERR